MAVIVAGRVDARRKAVGSLARLAVDEVRRLGLDAKLIGSAASGRIHEHSDIDVLVRGDVTASHRRSAERAIAGVLKASEIPYDLFFACDLSAEQVLDFERGLG